MSTFPVDVATAAERVVVTDHALTVELGDGRSISAPIQWYPRLAHATRQERKNWRLIDGGRGIHWRDVDEDITVESLLAGRRSAESQASFQRWLASRVGTGASPLRQCPVETGAGIDAYPGLVAHADWSTSPNKRWCAVATLVDRAHYRIDRPEPVGDVATYFSRLRRRAGTGAAVLAGFDFPIGLPARYARKAGISDFRAALSAFGRDRWCNFYDPAPARSAISVTRPFYPKRPNGAKREHLSQALGMQDFDDLLRRCDVRPGRAKAAATFWLVGGNQVGRAAITGWRDLIAPAIGGSRPATAGGAVARGGPRATTLSIWPFDGPLTDLLSRPGVVVAETYPGEVYYHLGLGIVGGKRSKRRQTDRRIDARTIENWMRTNQVEIVDSLRRDIANGFGSKSDGEDRFDAVVGLLGMLNVVLGHRQPGLPVDVSGSPEEEITRVEGWILGQQPEASADTCPRFE